jgi:hypothetical protein
MNASMLMQVEKIRLAASLWITRLDKSDKTTCSKSVKIRLVASWYLLQVDRG